MMTSSRTLRLAMIAAAVTATMAACDRGDRAPKTDKAPAEALAEGPLKYESITTYAKVSLSLPETIRSFPDLYNDLYQTEVGALKDYVEGAQSDRSEFGSADLPPYEKNISFAVPVETDRLFSMIRTDFDYSGGAHPNTVATGILWDKSLNKRITAEDLIAKDANRAALARTLCQAIDTAKKGRPGSVPLSTGGTWTCPDLKDLSIVLAKGDTAKKASGITFLLDAYEVGPYVEGAYYITLPFEALRQSINPAYAAEFGGTGKTGDVTQVLFEDEKAAN